MKLKKNLPHKSGHAVAMQTLADLGMRFPTPGWLLSLVALNERFHLLYESVTTARI